jgi:endonuclease/exonuclease/phosphatase family metal-dependent hydrolase
VGFGGRRVVAFAAHFRSMSQDDPGRRLAEAQAARGIVLATAQEFPDALVVLGGDLNDMPGSPTLQALEADDLLVRVGHELPPDYLATYWYRGMPNAIDHLYLPAALESRYRAGSVEVLGGSGVGWGGSDHAALRAVFGLE